MSELELTPEEVRRRKENRTYGPFRAFVWRGHLLAWIVRIDTEVDHDGEVMLLTSHMAICRACSLPLLEAALLPVEHCTGERP